MASIRERIQIATVEQLKGIDQALGFNTTVAKVTRLDFDAFNPAMMPVAYVSMPTDRHDPDTPYPYEARVAILRIEYAIRTSNPGHQLEELEAGIEDVTKCLLTRTASGEFLGGTCMNLILGDIDWFAADEKGLVVGAIIDFEVYYRFDDNPPDPGQP